MTKKRIVDKRYIFSFCKKRTVVQAFAVVMPAGRLLCVGRRHPLCVADVRLIATKCPIKRGLGPFSGPLVVVVVIAARGVAVEHWRAALFCRGTILVDHGATRLDGRAPAREAEAVVRAFVVVVVVAVSPFGLS